MQGPESQEPIPDDVQKSEHIAKLRAELQRLKAKRAETQDRDIIAVLDMRINQIEPALPPLTEEEKAGASQLPVDDEPETDYSQIPAPTLAEMDQAEKLIRQARLEKQRGNNIGSTDLLKKAIEVAPGSSVVMEAMADDLIAHKQIKQARAILKQAHALDPKNVGLERKYAEVVLMGSTNMSIEDQLRYGMNDSLFLTGNDNVAGIVAARFLSAIVPGVGQLVLGRTTKGFVLFVGYVICFGLLVLWQQDFKALMFMFSKTHPGTIHPVVFIPIIGSAAFWFAAMADLSGSQTKTRARNVKVERPKPPVDLPFD